MTSAEHSRYEELAALCAGGYLSAEELLEFREHARTCAQCRQSEEDFEEIVECGLPLTQGPVREFYDKMKFKPADGARERFLQRARNEGIRFSPQIERPLPGHGGRAGFVFAVAGASALVAAVAVIALYPKFVRPTPELAPSQSQAQVMELQRENANLKAQLTQHQEPAINAAQQTQELQSLREQLQAEVKAAESNAQTADRLSAQILQETQHNQQLLADLQARERSLGDAKAALALLNQQRNEDQASTVAMKVQVNDLSEQLRIANKNLDLDHQLLAQSKDVRDLMGARQLHVVDVRDTDSTGKAGKAFGRVFLTEGKSLIFYAFDLNETKLADAKHTFQVWGQEEGKTGSVRSLGFLYADDKAKRRWALKVEDPRLVSEIDSVFVTVEPVGGGRKPSGQRMMYAYLGDANHP